MKSKIKASLFLILLILLVVLGITYFSAYHFNNDVEKLKASLYYKLSINTVMEHKKLKQDGYDIHYFISPENGNKELIIFLHPAFASHACFDQQLDHFSKDYRVITMDMLGHGLSQPGKEKDKIDASVDHIHSIMTNEGYSKAHFIGVSMGTLIAQYFGLKHPDKVSSLTILGGYDINADNREVAKAQRMENIKWIFKALFSMDSFRRYVSKVSVSKPESQVRVYEMTKSYTRSSFMVMSGLGNIIKPRPNQKNNYPLLILTGDQDMELVKKLSSAWHTSEPNSSFHIIKNAGHCANMDQPEEFNRVVSEFLKKKV